MKITQQELIGSKAEVVDSKNKSDIGIKGIIKDETKNTLTIGEKKVFKNNITIKIKNQTIKGQDLLGRPKDRI